MFVKCLLWHLTVFMTSASDIPWLWRSRNYSVATQNLELTGKQWRQHEIIEAPKSSHKWKFIRSKNHLICRRQPEGKNQLWQSTWQSDSDGHSLWKMSRETHICVLGSTSCCVCKTLFFLAELSSKSSGLRCLAAVSGFLNVVFLGAVIALIQQCEWPSEMFCFNSCEIDRYWSFT